MKKMAGSASIICLVLVLVLGLGLEARAAQVVQTNAQRGDILLFGLKACPSSRDCPEYLNQAYFAFFQEVGRSVGIYAPLFGEMETLDMTNRPLGGRHRYWWGHIEIATRNSQTVTLDENGALIVLRPTRKNPSFVIDTNEAVEKSQEFLEASEGFNQPFLAAIKALVQMDRADGGWMSQPQLENHWADAYGVSLTLEQPIKAVQYGPCMGTTAHTDILDSCFWKRDRTCSSRVFWSLIWGWYKGNGGERTRQLFLNNMNNVNAVDSLAPGQVAWWLLKNGLVEIVKAVR